MKLKRSLKNLIVAFFSQGIIMVLGLIIPRLTLTNYGSETNGYMTMVSQIYAYIGLLEAGLNTAVVQALYKPVATDDKDGISAIISEARKYYRKIAFYYGAAVGISSIVIPLLIHTSMSKIEMILYFLLFGVSNVINFWFTAAMRPLLLAEGKNYVNSTITLIFHIASQCVKILLLLVGASIVALQLAYSVVNILQIVVYYIFFKTHYKWLDINRKDESVSIKQRNAFFFQQISNLIFSCTDVVLLSFFCDLKIASVYAVYMLIFNSLSTIISMVTSSTQFVLGQGYNSDREGYIYLHRTYESLLLMFTFTIFTVAEVLTIPFIKLYTRGVTDINYVDYLLPFLFCVNGLLATCKSTSLCLINFSFHAKQTMIRTFFEAGLNLTISIGLVPFLGIRGALIGTGCALLYRVVDTLLYSNHVILKTSIKDTVKLYVANFLIFFITVYVSSRKEIIITDWGGFIFTGLLCTGICGAVFVSINLLINMSYLNLAKARWFVG